MRWKEVLTGFWIFGTGCYRQICWSYRITVIKWHVFMQIWKYKDFFLSWYIFMLVNMAQKLHMEVWEDPVQNDWIVYLSNSFITADSFLQKHWTQQWLLHSGLHSSWNIVKKKINKSEKFVIKKNSSCGCQNWTLKNIVGTCGKFYDNLQYYIIFFIIHQYFSTDIYTT